METDKLTEAEAVAEELFVEAVDELIGVIVAELTKLEEDTREVKKAVELVILLVVVGLATINPSSFKKTPVLSPQQLGSELQQKEPFSQTVTRGKIPFDAVVSSANF